MLKYAPAFDVTVSDQLYTCSLINGIFNSQFCHQLQIDNNVETRNNTEFHLCIWRRISSKLSYHSMVLSIDRDKRLILFLTSGFRIGLVNSSLITWMDCSFEKECYAMFSFYSSLLMMWHFLYLRHHENLINVFYLLIFLMMLLLGKSYFVFNNLQQTSNCTSCTYSLYLLLQLYTSNQGFDFPWNVNVL